MPLRRLPLRRSARKGAVLATGLSALTAGLLSGLAPGQAAAAAVRAPSGPDYEMPFPCGDRWNGSTRSSHSPSYWSIDWNREGDLGAMVLASAPGVVTTSVDLGNRSYGRYVVVDHGGGQSTLYAHMSALWAVEGQAVDQGTPIGLVGDSGGSFGPHLHFEERLNRRDIKPYFNRRAFDMNTWGTSRNCGDVPVIGDWDGNGTSNIGIQRRSSRPLWFLRRPTLGNVKITYGWRSDQPLSGDWDGDGTVELGARRPGLRAFFLRRQNGTEQRVNLGSISDFGLAGDWNGDDRTDLAVWRPSTQTFTQRFWNGTTRTVKFGSPGDRPVAADWDGDGRDDLGVFTARTSTFKLRTVSARGTVSVRNVAWGGPTMLPVAGDWNGDGTGDVGVWNPATAYFDLRLTPVAGRAVRTRTPMYGLPRG